jgi:hypothetical protein
VRDVHNLVFRKGTHSQSTAARADLSEAIVVFNVHQEILSVPILVNLDNLPHKPCLVSSPSRHAIVAPIQGLLHDVSPTNSARAGFRI